MLQTSYENSEKYNRFQIVGLPWDQILMYIPSLVVELKLGLYNMDAIEDKKITEAIAHATDDI